MALLELPETAGLTFPFKQAQHIPFPHGPFNISYDGSGGIVDELNTHLRDISRISCSAEDLIDFSKLYRLILPRAMRETEVSDTQEGMSHCNYHRRTDKIFLPLHRSS
mmetsp:Transcript_32209/g.63771  ORF Transcript_32209/g.63771 Transcript_32209/m.63771 type:complete len:108 (+) Transcript_32209:326-649(+)